MRSFQLDVHGLLVGVSLLVLACGESGAGGAPTGGAGGQSGSGNGGKGGTSSGGAASGGTSGGAGASGAAGSAGSSNSGGASGSAGSGGSAGGSDPCANTLVCDDFEDYVVGMDPGGPWQLDETEGAVEIDDAQAVSGTKSVRFNTNVGQTYRSALIAIDGAPFPVTGNAFWGRMMLYITEAANDGVHWTMIAGEGPDAAHNNDLASVRYGGQRQKRLMANYWSEPNTSDCWHHSETVMPEGRWACMEWFFDGPSESMQFFLDGTEIADLHVVEQGDPNTCNPDNTQNHWYFPNFERVAVGWQSYQDDDARELWIDDVALALDRVGCPE